ncbi:MAG: GHMP family kinase ATP-binding protein [Promethearchaeota archaeon]
MKEAIINYFKKLKPEIIVQSPSRINLINPLDAVEGDFWMPSVAINGIHNPLSVFMYIKNIDEDSVIKIYDINENNKIKLIKQDKIQKEEELIKKQLQKDLRLIYGSILRFKKTNSKFWENFKNKNIELGYITTIPKQSGLGGSASIIIATLFSFAKFFGIYNHYKELKNNELPINKDIIAEMATKVEDEDLNITAGYADRYIIARGGLCFCSYIGKLYHKQISKEPLAICDRIDEIYEIENLPIIICYPGVSHNSGSVHDTLRRLYLKNSFNIREDYLKLADIAWKSRFALMKKDWKLLGQLFKKNTNIMNKIMKKAGFEFGIGLANNILIKLIEEHEDVYAAKLTGAGGGGCIFALVHPDKINDILNYWKNQIIEISNDDKLFRKKFPDYPLEIQNKIKNSQFFRIIIDKKGVKEI